MLLKERLIFFKWHNWSLVCMVGITYAYIDTIFVLWVHFLKTHLYCLIGCLSMIVSAHTVLGFFYACVCICICSAQLSMSHMDWRSRNTLITIIIIKSEVKSTNTVTRIQCSTKSATSLWKTVKTHRITDSLTGRLSRSQLGDRLTTWSYSYISRKQHFL